MSETHEPTTETWYKVTARDGQGWGYEYEEVEAAREKAASLNTTRPEHAPFRVFRITRTAEEVT